MSKKIVLFLIGIIYICAYQLAFAGLIINEIMYSPTTKQWVEIYNDGASSIDLTKYKILDSGAAVNGHGISAIAGGSNFLEPQNFAVVAKVPDDFAGSFFPIFKSALGIKASGDTVILRDSSHTAPDDTVTVESDSAVDGNSLQLVDGSWSASVPTPGAVNQISVIEPPDTTNDEDTSEGETHQTDESADTSPVITTPASSSSTRRSSSKSSKKVVETKAPKKTAKITVPKMIFIGIPFEFQGVALSAAGRQIKRGRYFWNFGDGNSKETTETGKFPYTYFYEGDYFVTLEYYAKDLSKIPEATANITLKVVPMSVTISKVGDQRDFFIELTNNTNYQMDISGWVLESANKIFILPRSSKILSKKKIVLSSNITNFSVEDKNTLKLKMPDSGVVFDYGVSINPAIPEQTLAPARNAFSMADAGGQNFAPVQIHAITPVKNESPSNTKTAVEIPSETFVTIPISGAQIPAENLLTLPSIAGPASVLESGVTKNNNSYLPMLISFIFIAGSAGAVYFIRQKKTIFKAGDDFKILDE